MQLFYTSDRIYSYQEIVEKYPVDYIAGGATQNSIRVAQWMLGLPEATTFVGCTGELFEYNTEKKEIFIVIVELKYKASKGYSNFATISSPH